MAASAAIIVVVLTADNTQRMLDHQKGNPAAADSMIITANLQPHKNEFLAKNGYYQISTLDMNVTKGSKLCPSGNCQYNIENGQLGPYNKFSSRYVLDGLLKVSVVVDSGLIVNSELFLIRGDMDKAASQEKEGQTIEILRGSIKFGKNVFSPVFHYIVNGTLLVNPSANVLTLTLQGVSE